MLRLIPLSLCALSLLCLASTAAADENENDGSSPDERVRQTRLWGTATIVAYGIAKWDYFSRSPHAVKEGWWQADTPEGGADKFGHAYSAHVLTHAMSAYYEGAGLTPQQAGKEAAWTSLLLTGVMELGDSFSDYGYSNEDMLMNVAGTFFGYKTVVDEYWRDRLDFRVEHSMRGSSSDPFTDYDRLKYVFVLKLNGFAALQDTPFRWLELHAGYFARGYQDDQATRERTTYIGIGVNFAEWFNQQGWRRTAGVLRFVQPPQLYVSEEQQH